MKDKQSFNTDGKWVPVKLLHDTAPLQCRWLYTGHESYIEPFFDETIARCRMLPENGFLQTRITGIDELAWVSKEIKTTQPAAFIFHISRCGSTLISQMLSLQPSNIVLSEVPFFDDLLRYGKKHDCMEAMTPVLNTAISLYGAKQNETQQRMFIKTDSWHIHFYKELRSLYPQVPFFLLYRKPHEVLRSQQKKRGMQSLPNYLEPGIFGFDEKVLVDISMDEYMGMVIESYLDAFLHILQHDELSHAINYHNGALQMIDLIAQVTGLPVSSTEREEMEKRAGFHAKFPDQVFNEEMPEEPVPGFLKRSVELYQMIETRRLQNEARYLIHRPTS